MLHTIKKDTVNYAEAYASMNLPTSDTTVVALIEFPAKLVKALLRLRLHYAQRVQNLKRSAARTNSE